MKPGSSSAGAAKPAKPLKPSDASSIWRWRGALFAVALVAYSNSFGLGLAQDSRVIIEQDSRIREATFENVKLILTRNYWWPKSGDGLYRPVTTLSFLANYTLNGAGPAGYHAVNFLLHVINVWLVFHLAMLLLRRPAAAWLGAALWTVHPIGTEAVAGVVGRADLLAAMSVLGGLALYVESGRRNWNPWKTSALLFAIGTAGVFAKENAAVLVAVMALWEICFGEGFPGISRRWQPYAAVAASLVVLWAVRGAVLGALPVVQPVYVDNPLIGADFWTARWTAIKLAGLDLWLMIVPLALACDRSFNQIPIAGAGDMWAWISLAAIVAIIAAAAALFKRDRLWFFLAGFLGLALLPTSNLVVLIGATLAERFLYLPSVAIALAIAALAFRWLNEQTAKALLAILLLLFAGRTWLRNPAWNNNLTLAEADVATVPESFRIHDLLARALYEQDAKTNVDRAIQEQERSWQIVSPLPPERSSEYPPTLLGIYYAGKAGMVSQAESAQWYQKSAAILEKGRTISQAIEKTYDERQRASGRGFATRIAFQQLYFNLANAYLHLGRLQDAVDALRYGRNIDPGALEAYDGLGIAYSAAGQANSAVVALEERAIIDGFQPPTVESLRQAYQNIPDANCALVQQGAGWRLNTQCAPVKLHLCAAYLDLASAYTDARKPDRALAMRSEAKGLECPEGQ